jgi:predicted metal-dependent HD superfamily phosphohydrolase
MEALKVAPEVSARWWRRVRDNYAHHSRYYHSLDHLEEMFGWYDELLPHINAPTEVALAMFFHDVIYDATRGDNEELSAVLFADFAKEAAMDAGSAERVAAWIRRTSSHLSGPAAGDLALFLDVDLAVLGRPPAGYAEYTLEIRREYHHVAWNVFVEKRRDVMRGYMAHSPCYMHCLMVIGWWWWWSFETDNLPPTLLPFPLQVPQTRAPLLH